MRTSIVLCVAILWIVVLLLVTVVWFTVDWSSDIYVPTIGTLAIIAIITIAKLKEANG